MKNNSIWRKIPLHRIILEIVVSKLEGLSESKLLSMLKEIYDVEPTKRELYDTLLKLEIQGYITVDYVGKEFLIKPTTQAIHYFTTR